MNMTKLEQERLNDFKVILRYHLCSKIKHFRCTVDEFYAAGRLYEEFKRNHKYHKRIFELQSIVNASGLDKKQIRAFFGYDENRKWLKASVLVASDQTITVRKHGTQFCKKTSVRRHFSNCYFLPKALIAEVFADQEMLDKVLDATSDIYTPRQRTLIFTQLAKKKNSRYKTNAEVSEEISDAELAAFVDSIEV